MSATSLTFEVMNATGDDWESFAQIHSAVNLYWQSANASVVAEEIIRLFVAGLFDVMPKAPHNAEVILAEPVGYWFRMTLSGRMHWQELAKGIGSDAAE